MIEVEVQGDCLLVRCAGTFDSGMLEGVAEAIRERESGREPFSQRIIDVRGIDALDAHFSDLVRIGNQVYRRRGGRIPPTAFVVDNELKRAFANMWETVMTQDGGKSPVRVFTRYEDARAWLAMVADLFTK